MIASAEPVQYSYEPATAARELAQNIWHAAEELGRHLEYQADTTEVSGQYPLLLDQLRAARGLVVVEAECFLIHAADRVAFAILGPSRRGPIIDYLAGSVLDLTISRAQPESRESIKEALLATMNQRSIEYAMLKGDSHGLDMPGYVSGWLLNQCAASMTRLADENAALDPLITIPMTIHIGLILKLLNIQQALSRLTE